VKNCTVLAKVVGKKYQPNSFIRFWKVLAIEKGTKQLMFSYFVVKNDQKERRSFIQ